MNFLEAFSKLLPISLGTLLVVEALTQHVYYFSMFRRGMPLPFKQKFFAALVIVMELTIGLLLIWS